MPMETMDDTHTNQKCSCSPHHMSCGIKLTFHSSVHAGAVPFADFSIFGPYGQLLLRKQTFLSYHLSPATGDWVRREQPGPSSFHDWYRIWKCYRAGMLLLQCVEAERLDAYSEMVRGFVQQYGEDAWPFISRADVRMRSKHLDRLRRELRASPAYGFQEDHPWSACYAASLKEVEQDKSKKGPTGSSGTTGRGWRSACCTDRASAAPRRPKGSARMGNRTNAASA